jgi:CRP/FNR family transcriptional regulator
MASAHRRHHVWYLKGFRVFSHLPRAQLKRLAARLDPQHIKAGAEIYPAGRIPTSVFLLRKGAMEIARLGARGRKVGLAVVGPGEAFGYLGLLEGRAWPHVATALEPCELWQLSAREFRRLCRHHPGFTLEVARTLSGKAIDFSARIESLLFKSIEARLAECMAALAERFGVRGGAGWRLDVPLTQQNLADLIGASRQHVSSALARMAADGLIRRPRGRAGRYEVPDLDRLVATIRQP